MFEERLRAWHKQHKRMPTNIIYYRDGVGDGMYPAILEHEVEAIEDAWKTVKAENAPVAEATAATATASTAEQDSSTDDNFTAESSASVGKAAATGAISMTPKPSKGKGKADDHEQDELSTDMKQLSIGPNEKPRITAVIVIKRHHTRFYPENPRDDRWNCLPGTCVDSVVTHPVYFDFFLQSHNPIAGTARPTYYFVIKNDMNFNATQLQTLTNNLCYTFVRCTLPVGYVPPAYYADQLCERARLYLKHEDVEAVVGVGAMPQKSQSGRDDTSAQRRARKQQYDTDLSNCKSRCLAQWKTLERGPPGPDGTQSNGPWHTKLNDVMFWM